LYQHDVGMTRVRRMLRQRAQQHFADLDAFRAQQGAQAQAESHSHA
ncbi:3-phenylpropionate dioxygenase, partial [Burkholderia sp. SIMBA_019]